MSLPGVDISHSWACLYLQPQACLRAVKEKSFSVTQKECFINALNCVTSELEKANKSGECRGSEERILQGLEVLDNIIKELNQKNLVSIALYYTNILIACEKSWQDENLNK